MSRCVAHIEFTANQITLACINRNEWKVFGEAWGTNTDRFIIVIKTPPFKSKTRHMLWKKPSLLLDGIRRVQDLSHIKTHANKPEGGTKAVLYCVILKMVLPKSARLIFIPPSRFFWAEEKNKINWKSVVDGHQMSSILLCCLADWSRNVKKALLLMYKHYPTAVSATYFITRNIPALQSKCLKVLQDCQNGTEAPHWLILEIYHFSIYICKS